MGNVLIKGATLASGKQADVLIEGSRISKVAGSISANGCEKIDAGGKILLPGFVNTHAHSGTVLMRSLGDDMQLHEWLERKIWPTEKKMGEKEMHAGAMLSIAQMLHGGTTCFHDMYFHMDAVARACAKSRMRALLGYGMIDLGDEKKRKSELKIAEEFFKSWNGKEEGRIRVSFAPHAPYTCSNELLRESAALAKKYNAHLHIHLSETRKEVFGVLQKEKKRPIEHAHSLGLLGEKTVASHCAWITKQEAALLGRTGTSVAHCPVSNMKLASGGTCPVPELVGAGANVCIGTDGAASNDSLSMLESMKFAALLQKHSRWDATVADAHQVLSFGTKNGARALGVDAGEIKEGKLADLVLLDKKSVSLVPLHNVESAIVYAAHDGNVRDVLIDGNIVMQEGKLLTMDEEKVVEEAQKAAARIVQ
ncbi:5'-deoxyadenosine deaminase [Candidatus Anstonella stagnisolia]|nr:5'-deoxyadenosine deaminase [Candidatus Anstonella stagnisolia]